MTSTKLLLKLFYFILSIIFLTKISYHSADYFNAHVYAFANSYYEFLGTPPQALNILLILSIFTCLICVYVTNLMTQIICSFFSLSYLMGTMSEYKIVHSSIAWIFLIIFLLFLDKKNNLFNFRNEVVLKIAQTTILMSYFNSGIWKIKSILQSRSQSELFDGLLTNYGYAIAEGKKPLIQIFNITYFEQIFIFGYFFVVLFQLSAGFVIFKKNWIQYFGFLTVAFHISTGLFLEIWFFDTAVASFFILTLAEIIKTLRIEQVGLTPGKS